MKRSRAGNSMVSRLFALVVLLAIAYVAAVTIPVAISTFRFSQAMGNEVLHGPIDEAVSLVQRRLIAAANRLGLEMSPEQIVVKKSGARYEIDAQYAIPVEFIGGVMFDWHFRPHKEGTRRPTTLRD